MFVLNYPEFKRMTARSVDGLDIPKLIFYKENSSQLELYYNDGTNLFKTIVIKSELEAMGTDLQNFKEVNMQGAIPIIDYRPDVRISVSGYD